MKSKILEKINKAHTVYIYNGFLESYFKSSKSELIYHFRERYKKQKEEPNKNYMNTFLEDFYNNLELLDNLELYFN